MKQVMDGNQAAAYSSYAFSEAVSLFPITPSSKMSEVVEAWSQQQKENALGETVETLVMDSEANVSGAMHGLLKSGVLTTTYTSSQGLLLMVPTLYKMVGELLPGVFQVAARSVSTSALNIHGDHSDVMALRQTGAVMFSASSVQEAAMFSATAHLTAIRGRLPVVHFFDGFDTSHELRKIQLPSYEELAQQVDQDSLTLFKSQGVSNFSPKVSGTAQGPELYFQQREAANLFYLSIEGIIEETIQHLNPLFGTDCASVNYYGDPQAESVMVLMGSAREIAEAAVDDCLARNEKVGLLTVHVYRPFPKQKFLEAMPTTVKQLAVLDRTKEPGASGEPLLLDVQRVVAAHDPAVEVIGGRYGLGGKKTTVAQLLAVFAELKKAGRKSEFTIGITDDVTKLSLTPGKRAREAEVIGIEILGVGSDGTVSSAKDFVQLISQETNFDVKADFVYPATKSRGLTSARLFFAKERICGVDEEVPVDFLMCHELSYLNEYQVLEPLKDGGTLLLNTSYKTENLPQHLTNQVKRVMADKNIRVFVTDANRIARKHQLGPKIGPLMMASLLEKTDFLASDSVQESYRVLVQQHSYMEDSEYRQSVFAAMDQVLATSEELTVDLSWSSLVDKPLETKLKLNKFQQAISSPVQKRLGNTISTCDLLANGMADGSIPLGGSQDMLVPPAEEIPCWQKDSCRQCNLCSLVCPHGAIRPFVTEAKEALGDFKGKPKLDYQVLLNPEKCTGCQLCVEACPAKAEKALSLQRLTQAEREDKQKQWEAAESANLNENMALTKRNVRETQFVEPLLKYSGACAGCGETPYVKLLTQLFGERLSIANATGCSSIWSASAPFSAFYQTKQQTGPIWSSSLFENNSAFGLGLEQGFKLRHKQVYQLLEEVSADKQYGIVIRKFAEDLVKLAGKNLTAIQQFLTLIADSKDQKLQRIVEMKAYLVKRTHWIVGGDGWAYDIDFGGLDHLISRSEDCNVLILDNEGYANTGNQLSKGTPLGAKVKFASKGNRRMKKDFGYYAMQYEDIFVAQVSLFSHPAHVQKVFQEAEAYPGTSIVIAYSPCIMNNTNLSAVESSKEAVACGYWPLYTYCDGKMKLYSKPPDAQAFNAFLQKQPRFQHPDFTQERVNRLFTVAKQRYLNYQLLKELGEIDFGKEEMN
ncbi:pyruvate:ferredoxin (flavodoxin) oxidoreductase [Enterococcus sp. AZ109]|uniref:pyruvate:ferredoxin (flavodoxin) oxidoreductase n=1 Tax=Enterococcus sp. AZ109 TaxID=2774634 RepID=UPI003F28121A